LGELGSTLRLLGVFDDLDVVSLGFTANVDSLLR
jgi:hypothetical protein